jgi:hypothetical protein
MKTSRWILPLLGLLALLLAGCATTPVQPWERAALASYKMNRDRDPLKANSDEHVYFSREASTGGQAVGGAGCGCN